MTIQNTNEPTNSSKSVKSTDQLATDRLTQTKHQSSHFKGLT